ncbi:WDGH domain-containing protein [Actinomadura rupiterrae]|uniref:WDGH domain-containing protein n=1 Tax=Actinomadura rupiterrae TaxID=559627 RepID=UPI0020A4045A|nr:hypothetical protein [Actinomadura rupiterrae]MCP2339154.1 hypothetical protein [Actinomadura rupiterrae]
MTEPLDGVYRERHHLVAHLAALYPAVMVPNADEEAPDWPVLYVTLPTGQVSWHIAPRDLDLFHHVPVGAAAEWDGHDVEEKYRRLDAYTAALTEEVSMADEPIPPEPKDGAPVHPWDGRQDVPQTPGSVVESDPEVADDRER